MSLFHITTSEGPFYDERSITKSN